MPRPAFATAMKTGATTELENAKPAKPPGLAIAATKTAESPISIPTPKAEKPAGFAKLPTSVAARPAAPSTSALPPGLAKRSTLPPGLAKKAALPPGLAKRTLGTTAAAPKTEPKPVKPAKRAIRRNRRARGYMMSDSGVVKA